MATLTELLAASALIVTCESICASGMLPEEEERDIRILIAKCCRAFNVPSIAERSQLNVLELSEYGKTVEAVAREMGA